MRRKNIFNNFPLVVQWYDKSGLVEVEVEAAKK